MTEAEAAVEPAPDAGAPATEGFADLAALRAAHMEMLSRQTVAGLYPGMIDADEARGFLLRAQATGAVLSAREDRSIAQRIIDYWCADLLDAQRGEDAQSEMVTLDPFVPDDAFGSAPIPQATYSPDEARQYIRVSSVARQWRDTRSEAYLLSGDALANARRFERDPDVAELVEASAEAERTAERRKAQRKNRLIAILLIVIAALAGLSFWAMVEARNAERARFAAEADREAAQQARQLALTAKTAAEEARQAEAEARKAADLARERAVDEAAEAKAQTEESRRTMDALQEALRQSDTLASGLKAQSEAAQSRYGELEERQRLLDLAIATIADQVATTGVGLAKVPPDLRADVIGALALRVRDRALQLSNLAPDVRADVAAVVAAAEPAPSPTDPLFAGLTGFQGLSGPRGPVRVLPVLTEPLRATAYDSGALVPYLNYSLVLDARRRVAIFSAAKLDRIRRVVLSGAGQGYALDPRLPDSVQPDPQWYVHRALRAVEFVGRNDIAWGPEIGDAARVDRLVQVYPNTVPVLSDVEDGWQRVSAWVQNGHNPNAAEVAILAGPIFADDIDTASNRSIAGLWKIAVSLDVLPQKQSVDEGTLIVDAFVVEVGTGRFESVESYRTTVAEIARRTGLIFPPAIAAADRGKALLNVTEGQALAAEVPALDGPVPADRKALAQRLVDAVREGGLGVADQVQVVAALTDALYDARNLTPTGRLNVLFVLSQVPSALWNRAGWLRLKAAARRGATDLEVLAELGRLRVGPETRRHLDRLKTNLGLDHPATQTVYLQYADLTRERATTVRNVLGKLGWKLPGVERVETASGLREVRYRTGNAADEAAARLLAADIEALGWIGTRAVPVQVVQAGVLEIWIGNVFDTRENRERR